MGLRNHGCNIQPNNSDTYDEKNLGSCQCYNGRNRGRVDFLI